MCMSTFFFFTFRKNLSKCYDEINLIFTNNILFLELQIFFPHPVSLPMPSFLIQNLINLIQVFKNHLFISQCLQGFFFFLFCLLNLLHFMGVGCKLVRQISDTSFFLTYLPCPLGCDTQYWLKSWQGLGINHSFLWRFTTCDSPTYENIIWFIVSHLMFVSGM